MNTLHFFVSSNHNSSPIIGIYNVLNRELKNRSRLINLSTCGDIERDVAIKHDVETTPCLLMLNEGGKIFHRVYGPVAIVDELIRLSNDS
jgi:hypothetical protein